MFKHVSFNAVIKSWLVVFNVIHINSNPYNALQKKYSPFFERIFVYVSRKGFAYERKQGGKPYKILFVYS